MLRCWKKKRNPTLDRDPIVKGCLYGIMFVINIIKIMKVINIIEIMLKAALRLRFVQG